MSDGPLRFLVAEPNAEHSCRAGLDAACFDLPPAVSVADDAADLLSRLATESYACAIVDTRLASLDPMALLAALREAAVMTPVVLVLDTVDRDRCRDLIEAGAFDCLSRDDLTEPRFALSVWNAARHVRDTSHQPRPLTTGGLVDPTTGLPNRALFFDRMERALSLARRENRPMALLLLDLNQFSAVNRAHGFAVGDQLLRQTGERLLAALRHSDSVCRIGDDEFAALLPTGGSFPGAVTIASRLLDVMSQPFQIERQGLVLTSTIGVALHPQHGGDPDHLLSCAEAALQQAKRGASGFAVYAGQTPPEHSLQAQLTQDLRAALASDELVLHYQPKISLIEGRISGVEALVRWLHPTHGLIYPDNFIAIAEQIGCIGKVTSWVLNVALQQLRRWHWSGLDLSISVNLSAVTLHDDEIADQVESLLQKWRVPPERLVLEITESAIISDIARARTTLHRLRSLGVQLSIDDFGTGYTSLAHLRKLSVSELKIDKSFVMNMLTEFDDAVIVRTMIELGHNLGLRVVAEGVENSETLDHLRKLGCQEAQGYYMSRPMDAHALDRWLTESPWGVAARRAADTLGPEGRSGPLPENW